MIIEFYIENEKLDLFEDEGLSIVSAVADITDITKNVTDYSKDFTVPASSGNNKIFKHYYNANIDNTFDARVKANALIYLNGVLFKQGKAQLNKVTVKKGLPSSYNINFFGNLLNLSRVLGSDKLADLDLSAYDHNYNSTNVTLGLTSSVFGNGDLIYSLFVKKQCYYSSNNSDKTNIDELVNIAHQDGTGENGIEYNTLRPSLKDIRIIEAIENQYGLTFSRDFFGRTEFTESYLWLNNTSEKEAGIDCQVVDFDSGDTTFVDLATNTGTYTIGGTYSFFIFRVFVTPEVGFENVEYTVKTYINNKINNEQTFTGANNARTSITSDGVFVVYFEVCAGRDFSFTTRFLQIGVKVTSGDNFETFSSRQDLISRYLISSNTPDMKIIDYLKGLFLMFKLVVIPVNSNDLYINTIEEYYKEGDVLDVTEYVKQEEYTVERGELLNEINFKFEDPTTILNLEFEKQNLLPYGDEEVIIREDPNDPNSPVIDGKSKEVKSPFEVIVYDRLIDQNNDEITTIMYAPVIDEERKPVKTKPHIHYNIRNSILATPIALLDENNVKIEITTLNTPSHCEKIENPEYSLLFSQEFNEWDGALMQNTLYSNHHEPYISGIFNIKRRKYTYNAILPHFILYKLSLNDVLKIEENIYRIDSYEIDLITQKTKLNLINSFSKVNLFSAVRTTIQVDFNGQLESEYISNGLNATFVENDTGDGVDWVLTQYTGQIIYFFFSENTTLLTRSMTVTVTNATPPTQQIVFTLTQTSQFNGTATADSTVITVDNTIITADNG